MNWWHDNIDWIGGLPYERASIERVVDVFATDGFGLTGLVDRSAGYGCNEFVFECQGPPGTIIQTRLPGGLSFVRRYGHRVSGPYIEIPDGDVGRIAGALGREQEAEFLLLRICKPMGPVRLRGDDGVVVAPVGQHPAASDVFHIAEGIVRKPERPFTFARNRMWVLECAGSRCTWRTTYGIHQTIRLSSCSRTACSCRGLMPCTQRLSTAERGDSRIGVTSCCSHRRTMRTRTAGWRASVW